eukprot:GILI01013583.1.p1 GENE.GILI01013583.1~~GILI01013583.1.p1  ORF type:complete len:504 (-),score=100.21 GILI01013583.1:69-1379(-)
MRAFHEGPKGKIEAPAAVDLTAIESLDAAVTHEGYERTAAGEVAVLVLAGGSGTRLGQTFPKGMLVCPTLLQQKSLFQLQCEKILKLQKVAAEKVPSVARPVQIPLLFMTSEQTDADTRQYFAENKYFGLSEEQVHFFVQTSVPSLDLQGKILIKNKTELCCYPGGNAGIYGSLASSGVLSTIEKKGVKYVQIFTVDNILCKLGDPAFTGFAHVNNCDVVVKACPKVRDHEAVGVFAKRDGKWGVVEYTEIGKERAEAKTESGSRLFDAANIAIHLCSISFLQNVAERMKSYTYYHIAKKPIPTIAGTVDGVKLEAFIFDLFEFAHSFRILSVQRQDEFSAIKNADDEAHSKSDTPYTAVNDLRALHWRWLKEASKTQFVAPSIEGIEPPVTGVVEISPLVSYAGEGLSQAHAQKVAERPEGAIVLLESSTLESNL